MVQPHLLFTGDLLLGGCQRQVERHGRRGSAHRVDSSLAISSPIALLAEAVLARIAAALELPTFA